MFEAVTAAPSHFTGTPFLFLLFSPQGETGWTHLPSRQLCLHPSDPRHFEHPPSTLRFPSPLSGGEEHAIKRFQAVRFTHRHVLSCLRRPIDPTEIKPLVFSVFQHRCISPVVHRCVRRLPLFHSISRGHISRAIDRSPRPIHSDCDGRLHFIPCPDHPLRRRR
eukprot:g72802.t1